MEIKEVADFFFELGQMRRVRHEGFKMIGVHQPDSIAEHSLRAAQIGYFLAHLEGYQNPDEVVTTLVFHDVPETRVGDVHKVGARYVQKDEEAALRDQFERFEDLGRVVIERWKAYEDRLNQVGVIAKDADYLEMAFMASEYLQTGFEGAQDWLNNIEKALRTGTAQQIFEVLRDTDLNDWYQGLKKLPQTHDKT